MRVTLCLLLFLVVAGCAQADSEGSLNGSISHSLRQGMTEREVMAISGTRVPDRIIVTRCGTKTAHSFDCRAYVFDGGVRGVQYDHKLTVLFEKSEGQWLVGQWY